MDYKELIETLRDETNCNILDYIDDAADAIEELLSKYDTLIDAAETRDCSFCKYSDLDGASNPCIACGYSDNGGNGGTFWTPGDKCKL